jgi:hypothetical protein
MSAKKAVSVKTHSFSFTKRKHVAAAFCYVSKANQAQLLKLWLRDKFWNSERQ